MHLRSEKDRRISRRDFLASGVVGTFSGLASLAALVVKDQLSSLPETAAEPKRFRAHEILPPADIDKNDVRKLKEYANAYHILEKSIDKAYEEIKELKFSVLWSLKDGISITFRPRRGNDPGEFTLAPRSNPNEKYSLPKIVEAFDAYATVCNIRNGIFTEIATEAHLPQPCEYNPGAGMNSFIDFFLERAKYHGLGSILSDNHIGFLRDISNAVNAVCGIDPHFIGDSYCANPTRKRFFASTVNGTPVTVTINDVQCARGR